MPIVLLVTLLLVPVAAVVGRRGARAASVLALWPAAVTGWLALELRAAHGGAPRTDLVRWAPTLGLELSFRLDGLSGLFALLVAGIGAGVVLYAGYDFDGHPHAGRFQATLFLFMAAMLGVVVADDVYALFVFWELTGFSSYLLVGFDHDRAEARRSALQALIVTGAGGLCLLAAGVLLHQAAGTASLSGLLERGAAIRASGAFPAIVVLVLLAAFTKSAQFPFHFWLPDAMAAPTPASAYLHSATMVKAGVYLIARTTPVLGGGALWTGLVLGAGGLTAAMAAALALRETDMKRVLAFSTVAALGAIVFLLGLGTPAAIAAALAYLVAHASYKGTLFLVAGVIDHATHTRDVTALSGLRRAMPKTALAGALGAASMAGLPLLVGFVGKEMAYEAALAQPIAPVALAALLVVASALMGVAGLIVGWGPFTGHRRSHPEAHDPAFGLWLPPLALAAFGLVAGVAPSLLGPTLSLAASAASGRPANLDLAVFHGFGVPLALSAATIAATVGVYAGRARVRAALAPVATDTGRLYRAALAALDGISERIAPPLQSARLASYILVFVVTSGALAAWSLRGKGIAEGAIYTPPRGLEIAVAITILVAAFTASRARRTMVAVLSLGTVGYAVALLFLLFGAPDLAMTQFAVETLTAVILVYVFWQFPAVDQSSPARKKIRDAIVAVAFGGVMTMLALESSTETTSRRLGEFFAAKSPTEAHGRNIVNVILVDFRALDTLGEITVLTMAAIGVSALVRIGAEERAARRRRAATPEPPTASTSAPADPAPPATTSQEPSS
jgi:multicomponent Na+:H+ antiporter subunit A